MDAAASATTELVASIHAVTACQSITWCSRCLVLSLLSVAGHVLASKTTKAWGKIPDICRPSCVAQVHLCTRKQLLTKKSKKYLLIVWLLEICFLNSWHLLNSSQLICCSNSSFIQAKNNSDRFSKLDEMNHCCALNPQKIVWFQPVILQWNSYRKKNWNGKHVSKMFGQNVEIQFFSAQN